jgi:hypothetical protein
MPKDDARVKQNLQVEKEAWGAQTSHNVIDDMSQILKDIANRLDGQLENRMEDR